LGHAVGNALEVIECLEVLDGKGPHDLRELCLTLAAWMFLLGRRVKNVDEGRELAEELIAGGKAKEKFRQLIKLHGGNEKVVDDISILPKAKQQVDLASADSGYVASITCEQIGTAGVLLGGGRARKEDSVDPAVGIIVHKKIGDSVTAGEALCTVHYNSTDRMEEALPLILQSFTVAEAPPKLPTQIYRIIGDETQKEIAKMAEAP
jgi:pyrimidine-nucleoside phosphorylase